MGGTIDSIELSVQFFGAFRAYGAQVTVQVPKGSHVREIKQAIKSALRSTYPAFDKDVLVDESALADESEVLKDDSVITAPARLAILPPVCGG